MTDYQWKIGQIVAINRAATAPVEKVTPSGRAVVNGKTFNPNGFERTGAHHCSRIEPYTPEIEFEMALIDRGRRISSVGYKVINQAGEWLRNAFRSYGRNVPEIADCERAERLIAALEAAMKEDAPSDG